MSKGDAKGLINDSRGRSLASLIYIFDRGIIGYFYAE